MSPPPLPTPDTHCFDDDTGVECWSHSPAQMQAYGQACREAALEEAAMAAESGFKYAKDGYQIADAIRSLKS